MSKEKTEATYSPRGIWQELKRVQWPTFKELMSSSWSVIAFTALFALYFFICEMAAGSLVQWIVSF